MFTNCPNLQSINLQSFNTIKVTNMTQMFSFCGNLENILVTTNFTTTNVTESEWMFMDDYSLVGGNGTEWVWGNPVDKTYAKIDKSGQPGYFCQVVL